MTGTVGVAEADIADKLEIIADGAGGALGWKFITASGEATEIYDKNGVLLQIGNRQNLTQTLGYADGASGIKYSAPSPTNATPFPPSYVPPACTPPAGFANQVDASGQAVPVPNAGRLLCVADAYGRQVHFQTDQYGRVAKIVDTNGRVYQYEYDGASSRGADGNLTKVTYPDGVSRVYHYNEAANTSGAYLPNALTGITDEIGSRFSTYQFNNRYLATGTEHAGGVEKVGIVYGQGTVITGYAGSAASPLPNSRAYEFALVLGIPKVNRIVDPVTDQPAPCPGCGPSGANTYDGNGNVSSRIDWNGNKSCMAYDLTRNLETRRIEGLPQSADCASLLAAASPVLTAPARMTSTVWSADWRLPVQVSEPLRITSYTYGAANASNPGDRGNVLSRSVQATTDATGAAGFGATLSGTPRTWTTTYNGNGNVLTMDGPRTDVSDITTYTYYANNDADLGKRGNVSTVTNALGQTTQITSYNAHGQPTGITDPNGLVTTLAYDSRLRLVSRNVGGEATSYTYDGVGQLTQVTMPDGSSVTYTYDAAHRLTGLSDNLSNRIAYTLDLMGNRTKEDVYDPANALAQTRSRVYNALNRLTQDIGATNQTTQYAYDTQGNLTQVTDPLNRITTNSYDALNRLSAMVQPVPAVGNPVGSPNPVIAYGYNGQDQLVQVTDPRSLVTSYAYDGLGNLNSQVSPDTGTTSNTYDAAGNILTSTDAKNQTVSYAYDALNRVTTLTYQAAGGNNAGSQLKTVGYQYDQSNAQSSNGVGRLTTVTETAANATVLQTTQYGYDQKGRLVQETRALAGNANPYVTSYTYDQSNGRMTSMTYPSGRTLAYTYDTVGRISQISSTNPAANASNPAPVNPGQTQLLATNIQYHPFGGVKSYTLGNNRSVTRSYDQDGRIASYTLGGNATGIGYDAASRIVSLLDTANAANSNSYGYDNLDRLTQAILPATSYGYQYDLTGNRTAKVAGANGDSYTIQAASNRIGQITGNTTRSFQYDLNGSTTADGNNSYGYDARGRMTSAVSSLGTTAYQVNAMGQRVRKTNPSSLIGDTVYHYDAQGKLIAETSPTGTLKKEYLYLLDLPVAVSVQ